MRRRIAFLNISLFIKKNIFHKEKYISTNWEGERRNRGKKGEKKRNLQETVLQK
jgi:hypothetical protein